MALLEEKRDIFTNLDWTISLEGLDDFYAQSSTPPEMTTSEIMLGTVGTNPSYKKAGKRSIGDWELVIAVPTNGVTSITDWYKRRDTDTKVGQIRLKDTNGDPKILFEMVDVWCKGLSWGELVREGDGELFTATMTLSVRDLDIKQL